MPFSTRVADGRVVEWDLAGEAAGSPGDWIRARVTRVLDDLDACFLDGGTLGPLFLRAVDLPAQARPWPQGSTIGPPPAHAPPFRDRVRAGQEWLVQVRRPARPRKGPRVSAAPSIPGRELVYLPYGDRRSVSRKAAAADRDAAHDWLATRPPDEGGWIVRTGGAGAEPARLDRDADRLIARWEEVRRRASRVDAATAWPLHADPLDRWILETADPPDERWVVVPELEARVAARCEALAPDLRSRIETARDAEPWIQVRAERAWERTFRRTVWLPCGGALRVDRTEAGTVIDVDTAKASGTSGARREVDLEAAEAIPGLLRLRGVAGLTVIDFVELDAASDRSAVERAFTAALETDPARVKVRWVDDPWLAVVVRERRGVVWAELENAPCGSCEGAGRRAPAPFAMPFDQRRESR